MTDKKRIFLYSGEGTRSQDTHTLLQKQSPLWDQINRILQLKLDLSIEQVWNNEKIHTCPLSPLNTVISQICITDMWRSWGFEFDIVAGHSTGEITAAYEAGFYSLEDTLILAYNIGKITSQLEGAMYHGFCPETQMNELPLYLSSINFKLDEQWHITLSGKSDELTDEVTRFLNQENDFVKMKLPHPWHHPAYEQYWDQLDTTPANQIVNGQFFSGVTQGFETQLSMNHWHRWLSNSINFAEMMRTLSTQYSEDEMEIIEIGFHPVLQHSLKVFNKATIVSSMYRGEDDIKWILNQRNKLDQQGVLNKIRDTVHQFKPGLDFNESLAYQGLTSFEITQLSGILEPYFPGLAPQDFFRFKTIHQLMNQFGNPKERQNKNKQRAHSKYQRNEVVIAGMSCRFPSDVETLPQFWKMLMSQEDQVSSNTERSISQAGFLNDSITRFDFNYFNIPMAEARTMDPQQILALELSEMLFMDAKIDPASLDKKRVGVYIGAWNQDYKGDSTSVYYPTGINPSMIAARISYHYDLRGPSWVGNTACSSSLLAVHYAAKDIEAGRIDYAIAGGINLLLDDSFTQIIRNSGFLSSDDRCKAFDNSANGYVRAEGGGLVLLTNKTLSKAYYSTLIGSSVNQNGGRSQVITAPHPEAQEELILDACEDANIRPNEIAYLETHGTGTKIGDPIEISAIQNTIAQDRTEPCYIGSVKSNLGHLESAAGIAGLIKSVAALNHGKIPANLHFNHPNQFIDFDSFPIEVVAKTVKLDHEANIGVSSFGFGGSNAHIIIKGAPQEVRKEIRSLEIPFDRSSNLLFSNEKTLSIKPPVNSSNSVEDDNKSIDIPGLIHSLIFEITGIDQFDPDVELLDQGLDSLGATELLSLLEDRLTIEIEPEILFEYPLLDQFIEQVGTLVNEISKN